MPRTSLYSRAEKAALIVTARALLRAGGKRKDIAQHLGVNIASLSGWLREQTLEQIYPHVPNQGRMS